MKTILCLFLKTESRYKKKLTNTESCFHLHKIVDSIVSIVSDLIVSFLFPLP